MEGGRDLNCGSNVLFLQILQKSVTIAGAWKRPVLGGTSWAVLLAHPTCVYPLTARPTRTPSLLIPTLRLREQHPLPLLTPFDSSPSSSESGIHKLRNPHYGRWLVVEP